MIALKNPPSLLVKQTNTEHKEFKSKNKYKDKRICSYAIGFAIATISRSIALKSDTKQSQETLILTISKENLVHF